MNVQRQKFTYHTVIDLQLQQYTAVICYTLLRVSYQGNVRVINIFSLL